MGPAVAKSSGAPLAELRAGVRYVFGFAPIGNTLLLVAATSFTGFAAPVILPILARDVFGGDASTLGLADVGQRGRRAGRGDLPEHADDRARAGPGHRPRAAWRWAWGWMACGLCRTLAPAMACMVCVGAGGVLLMASSNTVVQSLVDDDKRGRVMSLFAMAFTGTTPLGNLAIGALADGRLGVRGTVILCGAGCVLCAVVFMVRLPRLRIEAKPRLDALENVAEESVTS